MLIQLKVHSVRPKEITMKISRFNSRLAFQGGASLLEGILFWESPRL